ncbi:AAA family ATPase [Chitinophaga barathri]|nr:AAA family ATPase [Chitinophaga barathri]
MDQKVKYEIVEFILAQPEFHGPDGIMDYLTRIFPLRTMISLDSRFEDAYGDIRQHIVNNSDWTMNYLLYERLRILQESEDIFKRFLEVTVHPTIRKTRREIARYSRELNKILAHSGKALRITSLFEEMPVFELVDQAIQNMKLSEALNSDFRFYKEDFEQKEYPCFVLRKDNWNDYGYVTLMVLLYYDAHRTQATIGSVRIMKRWEEQTWEHLPEQFERLPLDFCSLGVTEDYYNRLKDLLTSRSTAFFYALRDAGMFPSISDLFYRTEIFRKSLIRENSNEELWRTIRYKFYNISVDEAFKFSFQFKPTDSTESVFLDFNFEYSKPIEHRVYALIGKNGTGKTKILSTIAQELANHDSTLIPKKPQFGKITSISYSFFDNFEIPKQHESFYYAYCGLKKDKKTLFEPEELDERFRDSAHKILENGLLDKWKKVLSNFIESTLVDEIFVPPSFFDDQTEHQYNPEAVRVLKDQLSSGQHILLYVLTELIAQIRENSLILYDEPETHLHPNAITELMNSILELVKEFNSFCIIGTHSPLVVQCIQSRNVFVLSRQPEQVYLHLLERESFGENLTVITEDIFGTKDIPKNHLTVLNDLKRGRSFEEVVALFEAENNGLSMNLNTHLYLKSLYK